MVEIGIYLRRMVDYTPISLVESKKKNFTQKTINELIYFLKDFKSKAF